ncbi:MAG TPA: MFS transporter [Micropepsaceae bacterium]|nr:MFS transporter [Micropepsaceae bacterium]
MPDDPRIFGKCAWRLIPFLSLLFLLNYLDRVNVGFAALTMNRALGFSPSVFGFGAGLLFFSFFLFAIPSAVISQRFGARWWLFGTLSVWGLLSSGTGFVSTPGEFYALRFLLGAAEAGFLPGIIYYLTLWFPPSHRAKFMAIFLVAGPLAFIFGGPVSGAILSAGVHAGLQGWQWLFLIEGLPVFFLALIIPAVLPNSPNTAEWLTKHEKHLIAERLGRENVEEHRDLLRALADIRVLTLCAVAFGVLFGIYGTGLWLPQIVAGMGFSLPQTGIVVALPYAATIAAMIWWGRSSDMKNERVWHTGVPLLIAGVACAVAVFLHRDAASLIGLSIAVMALYSTLSPLSVIPLTVFGGEAAAGAMALVFAVSSLGAFVGPTIIGALRQQSGDYYSSIAALAVVLTGAGVLVLLMGRVMARGRARIQQSL